MTPYQRLVRVVCRANTMMSSAIQLAEPGGLDEMLASNSRSITRIEVGLTVSGDFIHTPRCTLQQ